MTSSRLLVITTELFAPGGVQRLGREVVSALTDGTVPPDAWSLLDQDRPPQANVYVAAGSRVGMELSVSDIGSIYVVVRGTQAGARAGC